MTATATIWNQTAAPATSAHPADTSSTGSGQTGSSATISANDFLTLLVTELQNQDPTSATDPNEYINQLVSVNSLEQLIQINQTLSSAAGSSTATPGQSPVAQASVVPAAAGSPANPVAPGNLSVPGANPAAQRVAQSLSGAQPRL